MNGVVAMIELPRTPVRVGEQGFNESVEEDVCIQDSARQLKVHPHGLSASKRLERSESEDLNESLDCVKRGQEEQVGGSAQKSALEKIDINRMFAKSQGAEEGAEESAIYVKHSPMKFDMSSPVKHDVAREDEGPQPKRLKLELDRVPHLGQPAGLNGENGEESPVGSPEAIEMLEAKSSPMKEFSQVVYDPEEREPNCLEDTPRRRTSGLHTLTPIDQSDGELKAQSPLELDDNTDGGESFQMLTSRNEELVEQVHLLNQKLNKIMTSCDINSYRYKRIKSSYDLLSKDCETKLNDSYKELQVVNEDRDRLKERATRLKRRIDETRDEIEMLNQNQSILQKKYTSLMNEAETERKNYEELESKHAILKGEVAEESKANQKLRDQLDEISSEMAKVSEVNKQLKTENEGLMKQVEMTQEEMNVKNEEIKSLQSQLEEAVNAEKGANDKVAEQINQLVAQRAELESEFGKYKTKAEKENEELSSRIEEVEDRIKDKVDGLRQLEAKLDEVQQESREKGTMIETLQRNLEEANDNVEIDKAQVKELQNDKAELERTNACMESSIAELEECLREWQAKYEEQVEKQKVSVELEAVQLKNSNIEAEHLAELEQLHSNLSALQEDLKQNSERVAELKSENDSLRDSRDSLQVKLDEALQNAHTNPDHELIESLRKEVASWKGKYLAKEQESNKSLKLLAEDLYIQYSSKHEQKVKLLKKGYETKFQGKLDKLTLQNEGLSQEVEQLKAHLISERKEKQKLLDLLETKKASQ